MGKSRFFIFIVVFFIVALNIQNAMSAKSKRKSNSKEMGDIVNISKAGTIPDQCLVCLVELQQEYSQLSSEILSDKGKFVAKLEELHSANPNDEKITLVYVCTLADMNNLEKANEIIKKIKCPDKYRDLYYFYETKIAIGIGDLKRAEKSFKRIKYTHRDPDVWHLEGLLISYKGDEEQATQIWETLLEGYPKHAMTYYDLGVAYTISKEYDNAIKAFQRAWELLGVNYRQEKQKARLQQAYIELIVFNDKETGAEHLQEAIALAPNSSELMEFWRFISVFNNR